MPVRRAKVESLLTALGVRQARVNLTGLTVGPQRPRKDLNRELIEFRFPMVRGWSETSKRMNGLVVFFNDEDFMPDTQLSASQLASQVWQSLKRSAVSAMLQGASTSWSSTPPCRRETTSGS